MLIFVHLQKNGNCRNAFNADLLHLCQTDETNFNSNSTSF